MQLAILVYMKAIVTVFTVMPFLELVLNQVLF